jgi:predicted nucleic acid-binding protein
MKELLLDANVVLRHLLRDDPKQSRLATELFEQSERGEYLLKIDALIISECVYVLFGFYKRDRRQIASALEQLIDGVGVEASEPRILRDALRRFSQSPVDFQDAWLAAISAETKIDVASFDRDFDRFADVTRFEPGRDSL